MERSFRAYSSERYLSTPAINKYSISPSDYSTRIDTSPGFKTSPKLLSRSRLDESAISSRAISAKNFRIAHDEDRRLVSELNRWNDKRSDSAMIQRIKEAETLYNRRLNKQIDVEEEVNHRRILKNLKNARSATSERQVIFQRNIIISRNNKREKIDKCRDIARFAKEYEEELRQTYSKLEKEYEDVNSKREKLRALISEARQQVLDLEEELKIMKFRMENTNLEMKLKAKEMGQAMFAKFLNARQLNKDEYARKEKENYEKIDSLKEKIMLKSHKVPYLDSKASKLKRDIEIVRMKQIEHFKSLLKAGKDSRSEGLAWILKTLFTLNVSVEEKDFPQFLDSQSIQTLSTIAKISLEIETKYESILPSSEVRLDRSHSPVRFNRWNSIKSRIKLLTSNSNMARKEYIFDSDTNSYKLILTPCEAQNELISSPESSRLQFHEISFAQSVQHLKEEISTIKLEEVKRLIRECFMNKYHERFNLQLMDFISVIVGIENTDKYLTTIIHEQRRLGSNRQIAKMFSFNSKLNS